MSTLHVNRSHDYFPVSASTAQDSRLSLEAKGLLLYLLSQPELFNTDYKKLADILHYDKLDIAEIMDELRTYKYITEENGDLVIHTKL